MVQEDYQMRFRPGLSAPPSLRDSAMRKYAGSRNQGTSIVRSCHAMSCASIIPVNAYWTSTRENI